MKVRVTVPVFKNKETGTYHSRGAVLEMTEDRYKEIRKKGDFVEPVQSRTAKDKTNSSDKNQDEEQAPAEPEPDPFPEEDDRTIPGLPESVHYLNHIKK